jgi:oxalate decarboxylase
MKKQPKESAGFSRRNWLQRASFASLLPLGFAAVAGRRAAAAPEGEGKEQGIPSLKYDVEAQAHWKSEAGSANEATVAEFPVSQSIAGVSMRLKPGAIRELHWHALAAEWAYVLEGRVRTTVISPNGQSEISDFVKGDTWYFPRGHGHALQAMGPSEAHFLLGFDNGHFSEFGTFSVTDWISVTPPNVISRILNVPSATVAQFPRKEIYIGPGDVPKMALEDLHNSDLEPAQSSHKYRLDMQPPKVFEGGTEHVVSSKEFPIQTSLTAIKMNLSPGALRELHWHPHADEWQYYVKGRARMTVFGSHGRTRTEEYYPGTVGFVPQGYGHYIEQVGNEPTEILILFSSGEYQEISLSGWLAGNPDSLLSANFPGISKDVIARFPKREHGILPRG